jgi:hypothetical protein
VEEKIMKYVLTTIFLLMFSAAGFAQDITGIWRGNFYQRGYFGESDTYKYEVQLGQGADQSLMGVTYSYLTTVFYGKAKLKGSVNQESKRVIIEETRIVEVRMQQSTQPCVMTCYLTYYKQGDKEYLRGNYTSKNIYDNTSCGIGTVILTKVPTSDFHVEKFLQKKLNPLPKTTEPKTNPEPKPRQPRTTPSVTPKPPVKQPEQKPPVLKKTDPGKVQKTEPNKTPAQPNTIKKNNVNVGKVPAPEVLKTRKNELARVIDVPTEDDIRVDLYDNGDIDHDTVSVYLDNKLIVSRQMLKATPITFKLKVDNDNPEHELVMVAENLGEIPPNTSLMIVTVGNQRYEVRITSNEQKNALVRFRYTRPK